MILLLLSLCLKLFLQGLEGPVRRDSKGFLGIGREILADGVVGIEILRGIEDHRISAGLGKLFNGLPHLGDDGLVKLLFLLGKFLLDGLLELLDPVLDLTKLLLLAWNSSYMLWNVSFASFWAAAIVDLAASASEVS